ncbi:[Fe-Fe] hydrogenase large subunit C-terminal domain-containing protein [Tichowtungia aerotolerans]|uniref:PAS domain-containing protein n=1 Tax=Tichowtungia aerotolerans TaxID=2697043 RepID=A0A6P1M726_9BACT|nr:[Fe-Fe] hydrogenase large subunit C-terminal domain-containing protein [Tichowtungia aerotolerans]QHI68384.1 PAS domain-containing protein [Tichowtungia aerotolerans]
MNKVFPVYTVEAECQDCYKCLRQCPVKAIKVEKGRAAVIPDACIACGRCVEVCPAGAKRIRDDLGRVQYLLSRKAKVFVSLAPSYPAAFPGVAPGALVAALKKLGFEGVSETALGAELVNQAVSELLGRNERAVTLSTACPVAVDYIRKYIPDMTDAFTPIVSPMLAHGQFLRRSYGEDIGVVFVGPCIAKKSEADECRQWVDAALTFEDLLRWLDEEDLALDADVPDGMDNPFVPHSAGDGALYPVAGGMNETLRSLLGDSSTRLLSVAGLNNIKHALEGFRLRPPVEPVFLELLACSGGCLGGPCVEKENTLGGELDIRRHVPCAASVSETQVPNLNRQFVSCDPPESPVESSQVRMALARIGKRTAEDEINCGGCGYDTCRAFALAVLAGRAEPSMCVSNLRKKAQRKANALLRSMPSGVVIADSNLRVVECNENLARMFGGDLLLGYQARPGLEGVDLRKVVPFPEIFQRVLDSGQEQHRDIIHIDERLISLTVFSIEPHETVGGILLDVTSAELRREHIATRAREVIDKNLATVQELAFKLGEHMADTEILLRSIAEDYVTERKP